MLFIWRCITTNKPFHSYINWHIQFFQDVKVFIIHFNLPFTDIIQFFYDEEGLVM